MSEHVIFREVDESNKPQIEDYWAKKLPRLQKLLASYNSELQEIDLTIYQHQQNSHRHWYEARAVIHLPNGALPRRPKKTKRTPRSTEWPMSSSRKSKNIKTDCGTAPK